MDSGKVGLDLQSSAFSRLPRKPRQSPLKPHCFPELLLGGRHGRRLLLGVGNENTKNTHVREIISGFYGHRNVRNIISHSSVSNVVREKSD